MFVKFIPPSSGIWPVQETHSGDGAAKGDLSKKPLWNSGGGTKLDEHGKCFQKQDILLNFVMKNTIHEKSILWKYLFELKSNAIQRMSLDYNREPSRDPKLMVIELWSLFHVWWFMIKCHCCKSAGFKKFVWSGSPKQHYKRCKAVPRCKNLVLRKVIFTCLSSLISNFIETGHYFRFNYHALVHIRMKKFFELH